LIFFVTTDETHNLHTLFCQQDAENKFVISYLVFRVYSQKCQAHHVQQILCQWFIHCRTTVCGK